MMPFFFGDADQPLYGVHHEPLGYSNRDTALLVCHSLGREYMRTHRGMMMFSEQMAQAGYHVLRFDYFATGDSYGLDGEGRLERWIDDIGVAGQEIKDLAGVEKLSLVGLRIGASLAYLAAARGYIENLIMWDPVIDGADYIKKLESFSRAYYGDLERFPVSRRDEVDAGADDLLGNAWPPAMRSSIAGIDLLAIENLHVDSASLVLSENNPAYAELEAHLSAMPCTAHHYYTDENPRWNELSALGDALTMHQTLAAIKQALAP
jgi:uncharacterized protein